MGTLWMEQSGPGIQKHELRRRCRTPHPGGRKRGLGVAGEFDPRFVTRLDRAKKCPNDGYTSEQVMNCHSRLPTSEDASIETAFRQLWARAGRRRPRDWRSLRFVCSS